MDKHTINNTWPNTLVAVLARLGRVRGKVHCVHFTGQRIEDIEQQRLTQRPDLRQLHDLQTHINGCYYANCNL